MAGKSIIKVTTPEAYSDDELTTYDLQTYTQGRLLTSDPNTELTLAFALQKVRSVCRWHVSPVLTDTLMLDGPGHWGGLAVGIGGLYYASGGYLTGVLRRQRTGADTLFLPTKRLLGIKSITEYGCPVDLCHVEWSEDGAVVKRYNPEYGSVPPNWSSLWPTGFRSISVTFEHGYSADEAADWRRLVLAIADRSSMVRGLIGPFSTMIGPYRVNPYFGESRTGTLPLDASWIDDLLGMIDTPRYVRVDDW